jgi:hypothetical protein
MPESWGYDAKDFRYLKSIHNKFGSRKLKEFPHMNLFHWIYYTFGKKMKRIPILNYFSYEKNKAELKLREEFNWRPYGLKHYESIYTRFFQGYILPKKFGIEKRRAHLSTLINSGQISREEALKEIEKSPYPEEGLLREDKNFVIKKLDLSEEGFEKIMNLPVKSYKDYPNNSLFFKSSSPLARSARRIIIKG